MEHKKKKKEKGQKKMWVFIRSLVDQNINYHECSRDPMGKLTITYMRAEDFIAYIYVKYKSLIPLIKLDSEGDRS